jgi:hypothetical protein
MHTIQILSKAVRSVGRNEYQEYFLGDKGGRCFGLKSESLNLLEPSGPVQRLLIFTLRQITLGWPHEE